MTLMLPIPRRLPASLVPGLLCALALTSCGDNVGRLWDRKDDKGTSPATAYVVPPAGGVVLDNRPRVLRVAPKGSGVQTTTPIFVLFNEAMNLDSLKASSEEKPSHVYVRNKVSGTVVPGQYELLAGGRLLVIRPSGLAPDQEWEVVVGSSVRDVDRATSAQQGVQATFTTDGVADAGPKVVFQLPERNDLHVLRETEVIVGFSQPVDPTTVDASSFFMRRSSDQQLVPGTIDYPIKVGQAPDPRIARFRPQALLDATVQYDFVYTDAIKSGTIKLDVGRNSPPILFTTQAPEAAVGLRVGNPSTVASKTFDDRINRANLENLQLAVDLPAGTLVGDEVRLRVYGYDPSDDEDDVTVFAEETRSAQVAGAHTELFQVAGMLGTLATPAFKDGGLTLAVRLSRGTEVTGFVLATSSVQDVVPPELVALGPPSDPADASVFLTDLNAGALYGTASEELGALELSILSNTYGLFASHPDGRFFSAPFYLNRNAADVPFVANLVDAAGNLSAAPVTGSFRQRGLLTGSVSGGSLFVTIYDEATLLPVEDVTVLIEPGRPTKPATSQQSSTTAVDGTVAFTSLTGGSYTITAVKPGYHLLSVVDTAAGVASLPLRPIVGPTTTASGKLVYQAVPGLTGRVGLNGIDDDGVDGFVPTLATDATSFGPVDVRPNRPLMGSAYVGVFPPGSKPTYLFSSAELAATSGGAGRNLPPQVPKPSGQTYTYTLPMLASSSQAGKPLVPYALDLTKATGLDTANLAGPVQVGLVAAFGGFSGTTLMGVGYANGGPSNLSVDGSYDLLSLSNLFPLGPLLWSSVQAEDQTGNVVRNRVLFLDIALGTTLVLAEAQGVPTVTAPPGAITGSPSVSIQDRLDPTAMPNGKGWHRLRAVGPNGRRWDLYLADADGASGTEDVQLPVLPSGVSGLSTGTWKVSADDFLLFGPGLSPSEVNFEDLRRLQVNFARAVPVDFTIQ
ncbi:MAG: Ig-like domain-containing protein [Planctomycetota bacterium]